MLVSATSEMKPLLIMLERVSFPSNKLMHSAVVSNFLIVVVVLKRSHRESQIEVVMGGFFCFTEQGLGSLANSLAASASSCGTCRIRVVVGIGVGTTFKKGIDDNRKPSLSLKCKQLVIGFDRLSTAFDKMGKSSSCISGLVSGAKTLYNSFLHSALLHSNLEPLQSSLLS